VATIAEGGSQDVAVEASVRSQARETKILQLTDTTRVFPLILPSTIEFHQPRTKHAEHATHLTPGLALHWPYYFVQSSNEVLLVAATRVVRQTDLRLRDCTAMIQVKAAHQVVPRPATIGEKPLFGGHQFVFAGQVLFSGFPQQQNSWVELVDDKIESPLTVEDWDCFFADDLAG
jgi:hypothetical protein